MDLSARDIYLETRIATSTPQQLRLLLIEEALRLARRTVELWGEGVHEAALETLIRCREVVSELMAGVKDDGSPLARQVLALYLFLFTTLTESQLTRDAHRMTAAIRVLEEERATWQAVCQQLPESPLAASPSLSHSGEELAPAFLPPAARVEALSLEA